MAYTIRLDWIRKILNSCGPTQCRLMHDAGKPRICNQGPLRRLMRQISNNSGTSTGGTIHTGNKLRNMERTKDSRFRVNTSPNANMVRIHPLVRGQDKKVRKPNQRLPSEISATLQRHSAQRRGEQLARSLRFQDTVDHPRPSSTMPLKILEIRERRRSPVGHPLRDRRMIDSMRTRNIERMVRESQARLLNKRVEELFEKQEEPPADKSERPEPKIKLKRQKTEAKAAVKLLNKAICLAHSNSGEVARVKNLKISRMQTKLETNGIDSSIVDRMSDVLHTSHAYHMRIRWARIQSRRQLQVSEPGKRNSLEVAANLIKEEQRRLDGLKAAKYQLKVVPKDESKLDNITRNIREPREVKTTDPAKSTDLDIKSLVVDPKPFLTKDPDTKGILSVNSCHNFSLHTVENTDIFSHISKLFFKKSDH
ncbi:uncharacterized protein LOC128261112 [Drosophila gunungcola]|uniref:Uncharacterized protein n=1 Tax=Drosophila gunungcola TaxID=103775 RepID=A0A9P9YD93_9MUSC|nr:uncharacterized protein LOC128261112 [Drosophila gunungcola]KAI8034887.1 hypothetical protein M5D96_012403 [Drosophila gunungcola]